MNSNLVITIGRTFGSVKRRQNICISNDLVGFIPAKI